MKKIGFILILILGLQNIEGQSSNQSFKFGKEDVKYLFYNSLSSGVISGIGSIIYKKNNEKVLHAFKNGFYKGCIGGTLNFTGKELLKISSVNNTYAYVWPAKLVSSFGNSITYNGMQNKPIFSSYNLTLFFTNISFDGKFHLQFDPYTIASTIFLSFNKNMNFNFKNTLLTNCMFFDRKSDTITYNWYELNKYGTSGQNYGNTFWKKTCKVYDYSGYVKMDSIKIIDNYIIIPKFISTRYIITLDKEIALHEICHSIEYQQFNINPITVDKLCKKLNSNINKYLYINPGFGIFYLNGMINGYSKNPFEKESNFFAISNFFKK